MNNEKLKELEVKKRIKHFDKTFIKISKKLRTLEGDDQIKMVRLIIGRFDYDERLQKRRINCFGLSPEK